MREAHGRSPLLGSAAQASSGGTPEQLEQADNPQPKIGLKH